MDEKYEINYFSIDPAPTSVKAGYGTGAIRADISSDKKLGESVWGPVRLIKKPCKTRVKAVKSQYGTAVA
ncbi:MAG: hypothetical protein AB2593_03115 [Candidatus Thiodiazotropha sp.]|nr:hypothetical protein [Candidatus Thiodiazotropha taylori]MBT3065129.1 hypothetical protein [Candidatus Thiodiazotropha sp. (ex Lucina pensylvanica)]